MHRISVSMSDKEYDSIYELFRDWVKNGIDKGIPMFKLTFSRYFVECLGGKNGKRKAN